MINEGGKTDARIDCIEIDIQTTLKVSSKITNKNEKMIFYGLHYEELINNLKELGLVNF